MQNYLLVFIVEQNLVRILAAVVVAFYRHLGIHTPESSYDPYVEKWRHPENRKYITQHNAARGRTSHGHRQRAQKWRRFAVCLCDQRDKQTDRLTNRHAK